MNDFKYMQWNGENEGKIGKYFEKEFIVHETGQLEIFVNRVDGKRGFIADKDDFIVETGVIEREFIIFAKEDFLFFKKILEEKESKIQNLKAYNSLLLSGKTDIKTVDFS